MNDTAEHDTTGDIERTAPLAVRHRPRRFADVVGQRAVRSALAAAVRASEPPRQLLLSGGSGLGKTTIARIFAAALLCEDPPGDGDSCGRCSSCSAVWDVTEPHPDVIEMDAASNGGKDEIAALSQRVNLAPLRGRWKVFIVDEAHGITRAGADAFLKLLEEPPPHVIFVLATTEAHKMLPTIRGRCVELGFNAPSAAELVEHVLAVAAAEGWEISRGVAEAVVDSVGDGLGVRGALSALGRIAGLCRTGAVDDDTVAELLGATPRTAVAELGAAIVAGDLPAAYRVTAQLCERYPAVEVRRVLIRHLRDDLIAAEPADAAAAARRLAAVAEVPDGVTWLEVGVARATIAGLDGPAGLAELCDRADAAAARLTELLAGVDTTPPSAPTAETASNGGAATAPAGRDGGRRPGGGAEPTGRATGDVSAATSGGDPDRVPSDDDDTAPAPPERAPVDPTQDVDEPPQRVSAGGEPVDDAPPHTDTDAPGDEPEDTAPWENDPWFSDPLSATTSPHTAGDRPAKKSTRRPAPKKAAKKTPAKKPPAKKTPAKAAKKAPAKQEAPDVDAPAATPGAGSRRRTGAPATSAGLDTTKLAAVVGAREPLAARILSQCSTRSDGTELTIVVPAALAEGLRARPELREVIDAAATALGVTAIHWKVQRPRR